MYKRQETTRYIKLLAALDLCLKNPSLMPFWFNYFVKISGRFFAQARRSGI
jgi:hypothetical protein